MYSVQADRKHYIAFSRTENRKYSVQAEIKNYLALRHTENRKYYIAFRQAKHYSVQTDRKHYIAFRQTENTHELKSCIEIFRVFKASVGL